MGDWTERDALIRQGYDDPENRFDEDPGDLVGLTVFVKDHGEGAVLEYSKARIGSSSHLIDFEEGGKQKVHLERKGNGKAPFLVKLGDPEGRLSGAGRLMEDHGYTAQEMERLAHQLAGQQLDEEDAELLAQAREEVDMHLADDEGGDLDDEGDETEEEDYPERSMPQRTRSEEWMGADDPGYVRIPVLDGLMPFGHEEEPEVPENTIRIPEGWETATSRSTGKTYFINTITGESQYEFPVGPARMYASESDVSDMEDSYGAPSSSAPVPEPASEAAEAPALSQDASAQEAASAAAASDAASDGDASADVLVPEDPIAAAASQAAAEMQRQQTPLVPAPATATASAVEVSEAPESSSTAATAGDAPEVIAEEQAEEQPPQKQWECMPVRFYYEPGKTGFEASTEYAAVPDELIIGRYRIVKFLGEGAFSKAIQCIDTEGGRNVPVCVKIVKCGDRKDYFDQSLDEIKLLQYINGGHKNMDAVHIFQMHDFFYHKEHLFIVCEALGKDLYEMSKREQSSRGGPKYFNLKRLQNIARQTLEALDYLQGLKLLHNDLKPENILIKDVENADIKLIDFGSACYITDHLGSYVQSRTYRAPEVILGMKYDYKIDVWSLGCILAELWTGNVLLDPKEPDLITGEPAIPTVPCLLARMAAIIDRHAFTAEFLEKGRFSKQHFTEDLEIYEAIAETGEIDILRPKRNALLGEAIECGDEGFVHFLKEVCLQIQPVNRPFADVARKHPWLSHNYDEVPVAPAPTAPVSDEPVAAVPVTVPPSQPEANPEQAKAEAAPAAGVPTPALAVASESSQPTEALDAEPTVEKPAEHLRKEVNAVDAAAVGLGTEAEAAAASEGGGDEPNKPN